MARHKFGFPTIAPGCAERADVHGGQPPFASTGGPLSG